MSTFHLYYVVIRYVTYLYGLSVMIISVLQGYDCAITSSQAYSRISPKGQYYTYSRQPR